MTKFICPVRYRLILTTMACMILATPARAQLTLKVFVDPHSVMSGGTVGFAFAGDKFIGSVQRDGIRILYQTDLRGENVRVFAPSVNIPGGSIDSEHIVASSVGLGGFPLHDIYVAAGENIVHITHDGLRSDLFSIGFPSPVRGMIFDSVGTFGFKLLATTYGGEVYRLDHHGKAKLLASIGDDVEGMDVAPLGAGFGTFDGQLVVVGSTTGFIRAISASGTVVILNEDSPIDSPEMLSFVPMNLGASGSNLEGLYSSNWPPNVIKSDGNQFVSFKGDAIVMTELGDQRISRLHWNGSAFETTVIGRSPNQAEGGFFLTPSMLNPGGSCPSREPAEEHESLCWPHCKHNGPKRPSSDLDQGRNPAGRTLPRFNKTD